MGVVVASCVIFDEGTPDNARLTIIFEGGATGNADNLRLITSTNFDALRNSANDPADIQMHAADTSLISAPFDEVYSIRANRRFFMRLTNLDTIPAVLTVQVALDGDRRMDRTSPVGEPVEFLYVLSEF